MIDNEESSDDDLDEESSEEEVEPTALFHAVTPFWDTVSKNDKQALAQSDPISGSAGWPKSKHQKDAAGREVSYPNPDTMELDGDIIDSQSNLKNTETTLKSKWDWTDISDLPSDGYAWKRLQATDRSGFTDMQKKKWTSGNAQWQGALPQYD